MKLSRLVHLKGLKMLKLVRSVLAVPLVIGGLTLSSGVAYSEGRGSCELRRQQTAQEIGGIELQLAMFQGKDSRRNDPPRGRLILRGVRELRRLLKEKLEELKRLLDGKGGCDLTPEEKKQLEEPPPLKEGERSILQPAIPDAFA